MKKKSYKVAVLGTIFLGCLLVFDYAYNGETPEPQGFGIGARRKENGVYGDKTPSENVNTDWTLPRPLPAEVVLSIPTNIDTATVADPIMAGPEMEV